MHGFSARYSSPRAGQNLAPRNPAPPSTRQQRTRAVNRHDSRRGALVKIRVPPRRYRLRKSFDQPRRLPVQPGDPSFEGAVTSQINSVYGPRQLTYLIQNFGPHLSAAHCASAISLLAGMVTGKHLAPQQLAVTYQEPARMAAQLLTAKISQATLMDCARAVYGLARLQVCDAALLSAVESLSQGRLREAPPQALAGLALGLAAGGHTPPQAWLQELCVEAFVQMSGFGAQDLANLMYALSCWQQSCSQAFLQRCLTAFRSHWGSAGCHAPALVRFIYAVTQLPACQSLPEGMLATLPQPAPVYLHHQEWSRQREQEALRQAFGSNRASSLPDTPAPADAASSRSSSWIKQQPLAPEDSIAGAAGTRVSAGRRARSAGPTTYRLPSFNWLVSFCSECRRQMDRMKPAELSTLLWSLACLNHSPDLIFMECWYRASAAHMHAFTPRTIALALQALGMLQPGRDVPGGVSGRWLRLVLARSRELLAASSGTQLSNQLWGLAEVRCWPGLPWMSDWLSAAQHQLPSMAPADVAELVWALARLKFTPSKEWLSQLSSTITDLLPGFSVSHLAIVIWGYTRLGLKPDRTWLLAFKIATGTEYEEDAAQQLGKYIASILAQQHRQWYSSRRSSSSSRDAQGQGYIVG